MRPQKLLTRFWGLLLIMLPLGAATVLGIVAVHAQAAHSRPLSRSSKPLPPVPKPKCLKWTAQVVPINLVLPPSLTNGCGYYIPLEGNNEATIGYVLKNGVNPNLPAQLGQLPPQFERQLDDWVERSQALKILHYSPNTLGAQKKLENIPPHLAFVEDSGQICQKFDRTVVCLESRLLTNRQLVQMLKQPNPKGLPVK
jgi:hypothetical protein